MKTETSIKLIKNNYSKIFKCGYNDLYYIFYNKQPSYYNAGVCGWNCDVYINNNFNIAITTGYRNLTGVRIPDEATEKLNAQAKKIIDSRLTWDLKEKKLDKIVHDFWQFLNNLQ